MVHELRSGMRFAIPLSLFLASGLGGCLANSHSLDTADLAQINDDPADPPVGGPSPVEGPSDLAGSVQVDAFVTSGAAAITLSSPTATLRLNESKDVTVTVNGNSATGTAQLALVNAPPGLTATFTPATVTVGATPVTSVMHITATSDMDPANSVAATVSATIAGSASTTTFGVTVMPELLVTIPNGVATTNNPTAFGSATIPVKLIGTGTKITFVNEDGIQHRIHANGTGGIAHEPTNMSAKGGSYTQTINAAGDISFNCHIHPGMTGKLTVK